jgi:hypothetical protein
MAPSSAFLPLGHHPPHGKFWTNAQSSAARSAPVCPPETIFRTVPKIENNFWFHDHYHKLKLAAADLLKTPHSSEGRRRRRSRHSDPTKHEILTGREKGGGDHSGRHCAYKPHFRRLAAPRISPLLWPTVECGCARHSPVSKYPFW